MKESTKNRSTGRHRVLLTVAFIFFLCLAIFSGTQIFWELREYVFSGNEYEKLREMYEPPELPEEVVADSDDIVEELPDLDATETDNQTDPEETEEEEAPPAKPPAPPRDPAEVNAEYIGWLRISNTNINYPMVIGADNDKYLSTSFEGRRSGLGAIFMDYRCSGGFSGYHSIVYGHNAKNGSMFGTLSKYLGAAYLEKNNEITVTLPDGRKETWRIFAARKSDITDYSYRVAFSGPESFAAFAESLGAPEGVSRIITLSTCTSGGSNDERMLVHAAIVE